MSRTELDKRMGVGWENLGERERNVEWLLQGMRQGI